jgi:Family of unknown function (DUF5675)
MGLIWPEIENEDFMSDKVFLNRFKSEKTQTLGDLIYMGKVVAKTMELPWLGNANRISCIPVGTYKVERRRSQKYGIHFHVTGVPKRSLILIHHANYYHDLLGCIGVGATHVDIDKDGYLDITSSKAKMKELLRILPQTFDLVIS